MLPPVKEMRFILLQGMLIIRSPRQSMRPAFHPAGF
jgi:hypothetical protein